MSSNGGGKYQLISPYDNRVYNLDDEKHAQTLLNMGYKNATEKDVQHEDLLQSFEGWQGKVLAFGGSMLESIPGATALGSAIAGPDATQQAVQQVGLAQQANPELATAGSALGIGGTVAGMAALPFVGAAGEAGGIVAQAAAAGAENVALGQGYRFDNAALQHALEPAGQEKLMGSLGDYAIDFAIGAGPTLALSALGKAFKAYGQTADIVADGQFQKQLVDEQGLQAAIKQGRQSDLWQAAESVGVMGKTAQEARPLIDAQLQDLGQQMNAVKSSVGDFGLNPIARKQAAGELEGILKGTPLEAKVSEWYGIPKVDAAEAETGVMPGRAIVGGVPPSEAETGVMAGRRSTGAALDESVITDPEAMRTALLHPEPSELAGKKLTLGELQAVRREIYDSIDWKNFDNTPENLAYKAAGAKVGDHIRTVLSQADVSPGSTMAQEWAAVDRQYSNLMLLKQNLRSTNAASRDWMGNVLGYALAGGAAGMPLVGGGIAALKTASKFAEAFNAGRFGLVSKGVGKLFTATSEGLANVVEAGLYGIPYAAKAIDHHDDDYQKKAAAIAAITQDPQKAYTQLHTAMTTEGIPSEVADQLTDRLFAIHTWLGQQLPGRVGASDLVTRQQPDPSAQLRWVDKARTAVDPSYGLANPTVNNLMVLKQFYPETLATTQQVVLQQIRDNPDLPSEARTWASRVLGRPVTSLATNAFSNLLAGARQQEQQNGTSGKPSNGVQSQGNSGMTRLEQLQSRD